MNEYKTGLYFAFTEFMSKFARTFIIHYIEYDASYDFCSGIRHKTETHNRPYAEGYGQRRRGTAHKTCYRKTEICWNCLTQGEE